MHWGYQPLSPCCELGVGLQPGLGTPHICLQGQGLFCLVGAWVQRELTEAGGCWAEGPSSALGALRRGQHHLRVSSVPCPVQT